MRLQPNHPTDDKKGIAASIVDGLMYGCGDAVIGINPASDNLTAITDLLVMMDDIIRRFEIPTQSCVLTHVTTTIDAIAKGAPVDLVFQSIGGTEGVNSSFGVTLAHLKEGREAALSIKRGTVGDNCMYFETGQGSALSADAHHGCDQQTIEARAYAVARQFKPLLVNTVVGFIGPEYLYNGKEIIRAGLEDHFCGKLLGLPMGCDICYTNHAEADQDDMDILLMMLGAAGVNFIMGIPGADDIMLNYQSTSFHDALYVREALGLKRAPEFEAWLTRMGVTDASGQLAPHSSGQSASHARSSAGGMTMIGGSLGKSEAVHGRPHRPRPLGLRDADARSSELRPLARHGAGCRYDADRLDARSKRACRPRSFDVADSERRYRSVRISPPSRSRPPPVRRLARGARARLRDRRRRSPISSFSSAMGCRRSASLPTSLAYMSAFMPYVVKVWLETVAGSARRRRPRRAGR